jgi:cyanophycin synthetase
VKLVEIRDLDGPNIFLLMPAIKIELATESDDDFRSAVAQFGASPAATFTNVPRTEFEEFSDVIASWISTFHMDLGLDPPVSASMVMDTESQYSIAFSWTHRRFALGLAEHAAAIAIGESRAEEMDLDALRMILASPEQDDSPRWVRDSERRLPVVGITGTNGKTTTTRLVAHIAQHAGLRPGWSSSSGVYIDGEEVLSGDYSGPAGARRVLLDPDVDIAVLETARGGILLRGVAYESNDVSVFTNISADHLDLQGVRTVERLARTKSVVVRMTRVDGAAVLNADDALVRATAVGLRCHVIFFSHTNSNPEIDAHIAQRGTAIVVAGDEIVLRDQDGDQAIAALSEIPMTFGGKAGHMVENAMAATGAAIGLGIDLPVIAEALQSFRNNADDNLGRLNVFDLGGVVVIMDFAHNEAGLEFLIGFARHMTSPDGQVLAIIGTAGDRTATSLQEIGRIAAEKADWVVIKQTEKYLRGRTNEEMVSLYQAGIRQVLGEDAPVAIGEQAGLELALANARPGDAIAVMCQEHIKEIHALLSQRGKPIS